MADGSEPRWPGTPDAVEARYSAFISYNQRDVRFVRRLHRELETYRLPRRLSGAEGTPGPSRRLKPIFRDGDELTAAYDLTTAVREAIAQSENLIVICSPNAVQSEWVGREIELFRSLHGDRRIFAALIEGTSETAFHPALRGVLGGAPLQPLAADFRPEGGGRRIALLKLIGALTGVGLDDLIHRDAQRGRRRMAMGAAAAAVITLTVGALGSFALLARTDAAKQRVEATGLVDYMLTDLRRDTKRVGSLDQLAALNAGALAYYQHQDLRNLSDDALRQRAKLLQAMGEDDEKRGNLPKARSYFLEAHRSTAALLAAKPDDPKRIFAHAQSEYWVGFINWRNGDGAAARKGFEAYAALAQQLVQLDPDNPVWQHEVAYSEGNLGLLALRQAGDPSGAAVHFATELTVVERIARQEPAEVGLQIEVANCRAWLADSQRLAGDFRGALAQRLAQRRILEAVLATDSRNVEARADLLGNDLALARIDAERGNVPNALSRLDRGHAAALALSKADPTNLEYPKKLRMFELFRVRTQLATPSVTPSDLAGMRETLGDCDAADRRFGDEEIAMFCLALKARIAALQHDSKTLGLATTALRRSTDRNIYSERWGLDLRHEAGLDNNAAGDG